MCLFTSPTVPVCGANFLGTPLAPLSPSTSRNSPSPDAWRITRAPSSSRAICPSARNSTPPALLFFFLRRRISAIETGVPSNSSPSPGGRVLAALEVEAISSSMLCAFAWVGAGDEGAFGLAGCGSSSPRDVVGRCR